MMHLPIWVSFSYPNLPGGSLLPRLLFTICVVGSLLFFILVPWPSDIPALRPTKNPRTIAICIPPASPVSPSIAVWSGLTFIHPTICMVSLLAMRACMAPPPLRLCRMVAWLGVRRCMALLPRRGSAPGLVLSPIQFCPEVMLPFLLQFCSEIPVLHFCQFSCTPSRAIDLTLCMHRPPASARVGHE